MVVIPRALPKRLHRAAQRAFSSRERSSSGSLGQERALGWTSLPPALLGISEAQVQQRKGPALAVQWRAAHLLETKVPIEP